ncbi:MAG: DUF4388 domain-containing protein [Polyangiaceae bacterium]|nr:DUF4388 domain-containing protein [Polyangiaceae bacterium]
MRAERDDLVRIDSRGEVHAIGPKASQQMRARAGIYRMLPAPRHVVFLRYTGEDGRRDAQDGPVVRWAGEITGPGATCDVIAALGQSGWRGELIVMEGTRSRSLYFERGNVVGATTNVESERLGGVLYRYGAISPEQHQRILERVSDNVRYGESAVELGILSREQVYTAIGRQVEEVTFATFAVSDGTFFFLDGFDDAVVPSRHTISASALLLEGVRRIDEMRYFQERIPSPDYIPDNQGSSDSAPSEYAATLAAVDGQSTVSEIGRKTGLGTFETTKHLFALIQSKHVVMRPPRVGGGPRGVVEAANAALRAIFRTARAHGKEQAVRESLASFAVGVGVYDILLRGAGPGEDGTLSADVVAANALSIGPGVDPEDTLKQMLHEYVSFALFTVGTVIPQDVEAALKKEAATIVEQLRRRG